MYLVGPVLKFSRKANSLPLHLCRTRYVNFYFRIISAYENKILYAPQSSDLYERLEKKYNDTTWASFANMILDMAAEEGCSLSSDCHIDVHIR